MVGSPWFIAALGAMSVLLFPEGTLARGEFRHAASPSYRNVDLCPERCSVSGPNAGNWSVYANFKPIQKCPESVFYEFSIYDEVDNSDTNHRIHACSSFGPDFSTLPAPKSEPVVAQSVDVDFEIGWWDQGFGLAASGLRSLTKQMRQYADRGYGATDSPLIMFGRSGQATIGLFIGQGLQNQGLSASAMKLFQDKLSDPDLSTPSLAMQLCGPGHGSDHIFGLMVTSNGTFTPIQDAIKAWANGTCLSFEASTHVTGQAYYTTPLVHSNVTTNSTLSIDTTHHKRHFEHHTRHNALHSRSDEIQARAECRTEVVAAGQGCAEMAAKCIITAADFTKYNAATDFCSTLMPNQHVCCSSGTMPDFSPKPKDSGYCYDYTIKAGDNCDSLAAANSLTRQDIEDFNENTWGWNGCQLLFTETNICLSTGTPPFPATIANAVCGPMKPDTIQPTDGSDISKLNPCVLNACCNIWGQCGITKDFCVDTNTGAPGTAEAGTYGCISNCGTDIVKGDGSGAIKIAYFQGYGMERPCLYQDASQIDTAKFTHIHFGFGTLTTDYVVETGDVLSTYQFGEFKKITGSKRILSLGGWAFSTDLETYSIFRNGVTAANRLKMATSIANFIKTNDLDGVDIDWEYPGAPDMPNIPAGGKDEGANYLAFLVILKNLLPGKSVAICAPASYWYLRQYPLLAMGKVVDYIVFMTYDLHGQWDAQNMNSIEDCDTGSCLRSQVNLTETKQALSMITKAGVPGEKVVVGVTSYGRSFKMAEAGCWGPTCKFTGTRDLSEATPGTCTGQGGYIADAEINEIIQGKKRADRVVTSFVDTSSNSDILVYDTDQYVSYMSSATKKTREALYTAWGLGGTTDWAVDLQEFHDPPTGTSWDDYKLLIRSGGDPKDWKSPDCESKYISNFTDYYPADRWKALMADAAWEDILKDWETNSKNNVKFMASVEQTLHAGASLSCEEMQASNCNQAWPCADSMNGNSSGPGGILILNSLVKIHQIHQSYWESLTAFAATGSFGLDAFVKTFAPVPPPSDVDKWLLLFIDLITMGVSAIAGPFFNSGLKQLAYFAEKTGVKAVNTQETSLMMISQSTTLAKDMMPATPVTGWSEDMQDFFKQSMGQIIEAWKDVAVVNLAEIFDSTDVLWNIISDGKLIDGKTDDVETEHETNQTRTQQMESNIRKAFYGVMIPSIWRQSENYAFIMDSGFECGKDTSDQYINDEDKSATGACVDGNQYYLVQPKGPASSCAMPDRADCVSLDDYTFSTLPGLESTEGYGNVTKQELIEGSVRTYMANGNINGGGFTDTSNEGFIARLDVDLTVPGFVKLPVCSPNRAFQTWYSSKSQTSDYYPCDTPLGYSFCSEGTFVNQGSDASPLVEDCRELVKKMEADIEKKWKVETILKKQTEVDSYESCHIGFESTESNSNYEFYVGGRDVILIINEAISQFGQTGRIGAKGDVLCNGVFTNSHDVEWGIY